MHTTLLAWYVLREDGVVMPKHFGVKWLWCHTYCRCVWLVLYIGRKYWFKIQGGNYFTTQHH